MKFTFMELILIAV